MSMNRFAPRSLASAALFCSLSALGQSGIAPMSGSTTDPADWRIGVGQAFNGVSGAFDGVARLMAGGIVCSGTLLQGGQYVLTAAHCADNSAFMTADFGVFADVAAVSRTVVQKFVHPGWNGTLDTGADIAIVRLDVPVSNLRGIRLSSTNDVGKNYLMAGYGVTGRGDATSDPGWADWGYAHYGYNTFDVTSQVFNDAWDGSGDRSFGETYVSDYDNGTLLNNTLQRVADLRSNPWSSNAGLGRGESLIAGGDSGGGDFVWNGSEWLLSGVHSWGWQFCGGRVSPSCDFSASNSASYGDLSGSTAVFSHLLWIHSITAVPEPAGWALMLAGGGLLFGVARCRR